MAVDGSYDDDADAANTDIRSIVLLSTRQDIDHLDQGPAMRHSIPKLMAFHTSSESYNDDILGEDQRRPDYGGFLRHPPEL